MTETRNKQPKLIEIARIAGFDNIISAKEVFKNFKPGTMINVRYRKNKEWNKKSITSVAEVESLSRYLITVKFENGIIESFNFADYLTQAVEISLMGVR